jgi:hypothetical protein
MATWSELREQVKKKYKLTREEPTWLGLQFGFHEGRYDVIQKLRLDQVTALGQPAVALMADIADATRVLHKVALERSMSFEIGGIAINGELYVARAVLPLSLDWAVLDAAMVYLAREAARLRETIPSN